MQTRASLDGNCKALHAECKIVAKQVRAEFYSSYKVTRTLTICFLGFCLFSLGMGPKSFYFMEDKVSFMLHTLVAVLLGALFAGGIAVFRAERAGKKEVSNEIYARLANLRKQFPDLDGLREKQPTLSIGTLGLHMNSLMEALESDMAHPNRSGYRYDEGQQIKFFEFYSYR